MTKLHGQPLQSLTTCIPVPCWTLNQVGEWEVKHALRQGKEELRGKDLASHEKIEELLATVRQESASGSRCATSPSKQREDTIGSEHFTEVASLGALFSLADVANLGAEGDNNDSLSGRVGSSNADANDSVTTVASIATERTTRKGGSDKKRTERMNSEEARVEPTLPADQNPFEDSRKGRASSGRETDGANTATAAGAPVLSPPPRPRPRLPRKKKSGDVVPPELAALFRAPLLDPGHLKPPVAGIAAAAVAAGGTRRTKPGKGPAVVR